MSNILKIYTILISISLLSSNPYKPLDIDFLKEKSPKKKEEAIKKTEPKPKKENPN